MWNVKAGWGSRPDIYIEKAHEGGDDVSGLCMSADGYTLLSRSTDGTMKVFTVICVSDTFSVEQPCLGY